MQNEEDFCSDFTGGWREVCPRVFLVFLFYFVELSPEILDALPGPSSLVSWKQDILRRIERGQVASFFSQFFLLLLPDTGPMFPFYDNQPNTGVFIQQ